MAKPFISEEMKQIRKKIISVTVIMLFTLLFGTVGYMILEKWSFVDALYFSTVTLTTIGYGDLYPTTIAAKIFTIVFIILGVAMMLNALTFLGGYYYRYFENMQMEIHENIETSLKKDDDHSKWILLKNTSQEKSPEEMIPLKMFKRK